MLDMVRHDMATPIATAKGSIHLLRTAMDEMTKDQVASLLTALDRSISGIERLAKNLSIDASLDADALTEAFVEISVAQLLGELEQDLASLAEQKRIALTFSITSETPASFNGALLLTRQAIENLITNAIKFSPQGEPVSVTTRVDGPSIRFEVTDRGPGVPDGEQSRLFDRFKRSTDSTRKKVPGLGLGLSIVSRVARVHGGTVGVTSKTGDGSTFWISFPIENWRPAA